MPRTRRRCRRGARRDENRPSRARSRRTRDGATAALLRRKRRLPLPRACVRGAPLRPRRASRSRMAADRERSRGLRALATTVARTRPIGPRRARDRRRARGRLRGDERVLLRRDRPPAARHRRGDRVPARHRAGRPRRQNAHGTRLALGLAVVGVYLLTDVRLEGEPVGLAFAFANAVLFADLHRARAPTRADVQALGRLDGLAAAMLLAAVVVTPLAGWSAVPAFVDPVALAAGIAVGLASSVVPYVFDQLAMARLSRATYSLMVVAPSGDRNRRRHRRARPDADADRAHGRRSRRLSRSAAHRERRPSRR